VIEKPPRLTGKPSIVSVTPLTAPNFAAVREAAQRIAKYVHRTPVMTCHGLDELLAAQLFFKCENLQRSGAFKFRGATNAVMMEPEERLPAGFATHSSGNHAAALSLAASLRGASATVVMPSNRIAQKCTLCLPTAAPSSNVSPHKRRVRQLLHNSLPALEQRRYRH